MNLDIIKLCRKDIIEVTKIFDNSNKVDIVDIALILCSTSEVSKLDSDELDVNYLINASILNSKPDDMVKNISNLYKIGIELMFDLDDYKTLRELRTPRELDKQVLGLNESLSKFIKDKEVEDTVILENSRAMGYLSWAIMLSGEVVCYLIEPALADFKSVRNLFCKFEEADFLDDGQPLIKPVSSKSVLTTIFSRRQINTLEKINTRFKREFIDNTNNYNLNKEENVLIDKLRDYLLFLVARRRCSAGAVDDLKKELIKQHEDRMLAILQKVYQTQENLAVNLQKANDEILGSLDLYDKDLFKSISKTYQRHINKEIDELLNCILDIKAINTSLASILVKFELNGKNANSDKLALLRTSHTGREIFRWVRILIEDFSDTMTYYGDFCKSEIIKRYEEINTEKDNVETLINESTNKLNKTFKNIPSYRKLNKLAKENGYSKVRDNGDHGIFRRHDGSTVIIPQGRAVGKGLSIRIQKDVLKDDLER